jgi:hypothetical protein
MSGAADRYYAKIFPKEGYVTTADALKKPYVVSMTYPAGKCTPNHTWTFAGEPYDLEGIACDCGELIYHVETCPECGTKFTKHIKNPNK